VTGGLPGFGCENSSSRNYAHPLGRLCRIDHNVTWDMPISFGLVLPGNGFIQLRLDHFLERTAFLISAKSSSSDSVQSGFLHRGSLWGNTEKRHKPYLSSRLFSMGELILPAMNERGFLQSFHLFTPVGKGTSMETYKTTSRRALALIQIWASEPIVPLSHIRRSLSHGSRPYPGVVGNDVPTERAAWVFPSWGEYSTNVLNKQEGKERLRARTFPPPFENRGFQARPR